MPQAVAHILVLIILISLFRDWYLKRGQKRNFSSHYILIAALGGVLPDIDFIFSIFLWLGGAENWYIHKTFTHSLFIPIGLFVLFLIFRPFKAKARICNIGRHKLKLATIFLILAVGALIHIFLDSLVGGPVFFFYPLSQIDYGLYLTDYLPSELQGMATALLDGILLVLWMIYLEVKHKVSEFI